MTLTVSINTYDDADLLDNCLASVREQLPDATIHVVDGRYDTWPAADDNTEQTTRPIAGQYGCEYDPAGPFESEAAKHRYRRDIVDSDRVLFMDADERLMQFAPPDDPTVDYRARIFNALVYGPAISYYPRYFDSGRMGVERVDKFMMDGKVLRTDGITICHRADLRSDAYRAAKRERFDNEDRGPWYDDYLENLAEEGHDAEFEACPNCGRESVTVSRLTGYKPRDSDRSRVAIRGDAERGETFSRVRCCTAGDGCYREIVEETLDEFRYVPDNLEQGFDEDLSRIKLELMACGWELAKTVPTDTFDRYEPNARLWIRDEWDGNI